MTVKIYLDKVNNAPEGWTKCFSSEEVIDLLTKSKVERVSMDYYLDDEEKSTSEELLNWIENEVMFKNFNPPILRAHCEDRFKKRRLQFRIQQIKKIIKHRKETKHD